MNIPAQQLESEPSATQLIVKIDQLRSQCLLWCNVLVILAFPLAVFSVTIRSWIFVFFIAFIGCGILGFTSWIHFCSYRSLKSTSACCSPLTALTVTDNANLVVLVSSLCSLVAGIVSASMRSEHRTFAVLASISAFLMFVASGVLFPKLKELRRLAVKSSDFQLPITYIPPGPQTIVVMGGHQGIYQDFYAPQVVMAAPVYAAEPVPRPGAQYSGGQQQQPQVEFVQDAAVR